MNNTMKDVQTFANKAFRQHMHTSKSQAVLQLPYECVSDKPLCAARPTVPRGTLPNPYVRIVTSKQSGKNQMW